MYVGCGCGTQSADVAADWAHQLAVEQALLLDIVFVAYFVDDNVDRPLRSLDALANHFQARTWRPAGRACRVN